MGFSGRFLVQPDAVFSGRPNSEGLLSLIAVYIIITLLSSHCPNHFEASTLNSKSSSGEMRKKAEKRQGNNPSSFFSPFFSLS